MSHGNGTLLRGKKKTLIAIFSIGTSIIAHASNQTNVVIGQNGSQITEYAHSAQALSFTPNLHSFIPLSANNTVVSHETSTNPWSHYLNKRIHITSKYRDLSFKGTLISVNGHSITIQYSGTSVTLPANDFYIMGNKAAPDATSSAIHIPNDGLVTYHTDELSWKPALTLVFDENDVSVIQQALISNTGSKPQSLKAPYLNYRPQGAPVMEMKSARVSAMADTSVAPTYQENQITYRLTEQYYLPAYTDTMITLKNETYPIDSKVNVGSVYAYPNQSGPRPITFNQTTTFTLKDESVSGTYKTLWRQNERYVAGQPVMIRSARSNQKVDVVTSKSYDLIGTLKLINTTSRKLPASQTWELEVKNYSDIRQRMEFTHQANGIIRSVSSSHLKINSNNTILFNRELAPNEKYIVRYQISVTE
ncbi:SIMPL domain-containing protein [Marinomonas mediterranea]|jgi:hypothetical protein|uniref:DUF4139 domain-containing protein n=1 Tax=Marinomonas mediterranea (strain ATCC 700492 / JCM 21426 / NBRC 103028 / MMB-1) TaxID=717774 RepID=F2JXA4_MARM1|nr:hypothetical protein [Marinomonas mediterranea]ADZ90710.1 hypothetical protein Marme_1443 [Marinomonas mediterranea MMB-1]WCN16873.1 hypothetical protein GV053_07260 [Marinomonas mediterranea MMB-1]